MEDTVSETFAYNTEIPLKSQKYKDPILKEELQEIYVS